MASSIIIVIALVLAPGLHSAVVQTGDLPRISTFPQATEGVAIQTLPGLLEVPVLRPLPLPVPELRPELLPEVGTVPELRPEPLPEVEAVLPELITVNPCDACFSYMTELIGQLAETTLPQPHPMPEVEVVPEDDIIGILPHPMPEVEIVPNPLPEFIPIVPEVETRPEPVQPEIRPLPFYFDN